MHRLPFRLDVCTQRFLVAPMLSTLQSVQSRLTDAAEDDALSNVLIVLGYWRSGTTMLHEYLSLDASRTYPTTYACMNPHHFLLTQERMLAQGTRETERPMDSRIVRADTPQESEFAFLALGAPSPYQALMFPSTLERSLAIADPDNLSQHDREFWAQTFTQFLRGVYLAGNRRPLVLKSPAHGFRLQTLSRLLPNARYVLIVRDPLPVFESAVRMWLSLFALYAFEPAPKPDAIREIVLANRLHFEKKLQQGLSELPTHSWTTLQYESLVADPAATLEAVYTKLGLSGFDAMREAVVRKAQENSDYNSRTDQPNEFWRRRIQESWKDIFARYGYAP